MADILHRIGIEHCAPAQVYDALTTLDGLSGWWTETTSGEVEPGGVLEFRFHQGGVDMRVSKLDPDRLVRWDVVDSPPEWIGTSVQYELRRDGDYTIVLFSHEGWREPVEFMHHCTTKWGTFLMSLKQFVETGTGSPAPHDVQISDWH